MSRGRRGVSPAGRACCRKISLIFTCIGNGKYSMDQWEPCYKFKPVYDNPHYPDPQSRMRMTLAIGKMAVIVDAFTALLADQ